MVQDIEDISVEKDSIRIAASQRSGLVSISNNLASTLTETDSRTKKTTEIPDTFNHVDCTSVEFEDENGNEGEMEKNGNGEAEKFHDDNYILPGKQSKI